MNKQSYDHITISNDEHITNFSSLILQQKTRCEWSDSNVCGGKPMGPGGKYEGHDSGNFVYFLVVSNILFGISQ